MGVVDHQLDVTLAASSLADEPQRVEHQPAGVTGAGAGEHPFVSAIDLRELKLQRGVGIAVARQLLGPFEVALDVDQLGLEPVDPAHQTCQQRGRPCAEVVVAHRQLVEPGGEHRQPVAGAERLHRPFRLLVAQLERRQTDRGDDVQPLKAVLQV